jgi:hypothetical protein
MLVPVAEAGLRIIPQNQQIKSMHLNKLSRLAITLSVGTFVQVVSTPKIVQAQIKPSISEVSEQPNPPTSGQENPPVTDKPDERVAASTRQRQEPSNIEGSSGNGNGGDIILLPDSTAILIKPDSTARLIKDFGISACSSAEGGSISLVSGDIVITTEATIAIPNGEAPVGILDATGRGRQ